MSAGLVYLAGSREELHAKELEYAKITEQWGNAGAQLLETFGHYIGGLEAKLARAHELLESARTLADQRRMELEAARGEVERLAPHEEEAMMLRGMNENQKALIDQLRSENKRLWASMDGKIR